MTEPDIIDTLYNKLQQELISTLFPEGTTMDENTTPDAETPTAPKFTTKDLMNWFGEVRPCGPTEFMAFWKSCTDDQKDYYRTAFMALQTA